MKKIKKLSKKQKDSILDENSKSRFSKEHIMEYLDLENISPKKVKKELSISSFLEDILKRRKKD